MLIRRLANHAGPLSSGAGVRCESCAAVFPFLPARRSATRKPRTFAASLDAAKYPTLLHVRQRSWGSLTPFAGLLPQTGGETRFRITGPTCRLSAFSLHPIVFIGPNHVTILYCLVSAIRRRRWIRLLGFAPVCGRPRLGPQRKRSVPRSGFLPWVSSSFRYAGTAT